MSDYQRPDFHAHNHDGVSGGGILITLGVIAAVFAVFVVLGALAPTAAPPAEEGAPVAATPIE